MTDDDSDAWDSPTADSSESAMSDQDEEEVNPDHFEAVSRRCLFEESLFSQIIPDDVVREVLERTSVASSLLTAQPTLAKLQPSAPGGGFFAINDFSSSSESEPFGVNWYTTNTSYSVMACRRLQNLIISETWLRRSS